MELTDDQKRKIAAWIDEGMKLSDIQHRLAAEDNVHLTYMEVRFLVDDMKLTPKDIAPRQPEMSIAAAAAPEKKPAGADSFEPEPLEETVPASGGRVAVKVDEITRPGSVVSGSVTFSDGKKSGWYLDQLGRLGMVPDEQGYRPPPSDIAEFQAALEKELMRLGI
jgi:hypothetical protein